MGDPIKAAETTVKADEATVRAKIVAFVTKNAWYVAAGVAALIVIVIAKVL